jgi:hypothetical protein
MAHDLQDAVGDTTSTTGTSDFVIDGVALTGCVSFASALTNGLTYGYRCETSDKTSWEVGSGTWTSATSTLSRTTVSRSSNGNAKVSFAAGAKSIGIVIQAQDFIADVATATHAATSKATPVDADELPLVDSAASNVLKKLTWANLKATLKTYFDSLTTTLTNKRITARVLSEAFSATPTINTDNYDEYHATAMSGAITSMTTNLTGTPVTGDILVCEFTDNGTARAITWGTSFESSTVALPTTTVISALLTVTLKWNAVTSKWRCVGVA